MYLNVSILSFIRFHRIRFSTVRADVKSTSKRNYKYNLYDVYCFQTIVSDFEFWKFKVKHIRLVSASAAQVVRNNFQVLF